MKRGETVEEYPIVEEIESGWAAKGNGWAVHAPTREEAIRLFRKREEYYEWLDKQPPFWVGHT